MQTLESQTLESKTEKKLTRGRNWTSATSQLRFMHKYFCVKCEKLLAEKKKEFLKNVFVIQLK